MVEEARYSAIGPAAKLHSTLGAAQTELFHQQAAASQVERPTEFVYQYDMDENGALYFLGSFGRKRLW